MRRPARPRRARAHDLTGKGVLFYDADCGFCRWCVAKVIAWDSKERIVPMAIGSPEAAALLADVEPARRSASWHFRDRDGTVFSAGAAFAPLLRAIARGLAARRLRLALSTRSRACLSPRRLQPRRAWDPRHRRRPSEGRSTSQRFFTQSAPMSVAPMTGSSTRQLTRPEKSSGRTGVEYTANGATSRSSFTASRR